MAVNLLALPDELLIEILVAADSVLDRLRFGAVCRRFGQLIDRRCVWRRFQTVTINYCGDLVVQISAAGAAIVRFHFADVEKSDGAFGWLFYVCQPRQLTVWSSQQAGSERFLGYLLDAIPAGDAILSVERLQLDLWVVSVGDYSVMEVLLDKLSRSLTHLDLRLEELPPVKQHGPPLGTWLRNCVKLAVLRCHLDGDTRLVDETMENLTSVLSSFSSLEAIRFNQPRWQIELLNRNTTATISHLCCDGCYISQFRQYCSQLSEAVRGNIRSLCCIRSEDMGSADFDVSTMPRLFPHCRRVEFRGELSNAVLTAICDASTVLHGDEDGGGEVFRIRMSMHPGRFVDYLVYGRDSVRIRTTNGGFRCALEENFCRL